MNQNKNKCNDRKKFKSNQVTISPYNVEVPALTIKLIDLSYTMIKTVFLIFG